MSARARSLAVARQLRRSSRGNTLIEFALIMPVLMLLIVGILELGYTAYVTATVQGAVQKAARDASLQTNNSTSAAAALDDNVKAQIATLGHGLSNPTITRRFFRNYNEVAAKQFEPFVDKNGNKRCDNNESYTDTNWNLVWDSDGGNAGGGGAQDRAVYTVSVTYPRLLPKPDFLGLSNTETVTATTILSNQPYADQATYAANPVSRKCT